jgi:recyclin-1
VAEYIIPLLTRAREISNEIFLQATAAAFVQSWRLVDALIDVTNGTVIEKDKDPTKDPSTSVTRTRIEDVM